MYTEAALGPCLFECVPNNLEAYNVMVQRITKALKIVEGLSDVKPIMASDIYKEIMSRWPFSAESLYDLQGKRIDTNALLMAFSNFPVSRKRYDYETQSNTVCCKRNDIYDRWFGFIMSWRDNVQCQKGILANDLCTSTQIETVPVLKTRDEWYCAAFPWLTVTNFKLPTSGYQYKPPLNWRELHRTNRLKINRNSRIGFIDKENYIWVWHADSRHDEHWDVQIPRGKYFRVFIDDVGKGFKDE